MYNKANLKTGFKFSPEINGGEGLCSQSPPWQFPALFILTHTLAKKVLFFPIKI